MSATSIAYPLVTGINWDKKDGVLTVESGDNHIIDNNLTWVSAAQLDETFPQPELVARLEFIWDNHKRGVVAIDAYGHTLAHITNALLGYRGAGPGLSEEVCAFFHVSKRVFDQINAATKDSRPYVVAVFRTSSSSWDWERIV